MENKNFSKIYQLILWSITLVCIFVGVMIYCFRFVDIDSPSSEEVVIESNDIVSDIDADLEAADLTIHYGNEFLVSHTFSEKYAPTITTTDGKLTIRQDKPLRHVNSLKGYCIDITIPEGTNLNTVDIKADASDIDMSNINGKSLTISTGAGDLDFSNISFNSCVIDTEAGDVDIDNSNIASVNLSAEAGDIDVESSNIDSMNVITSAGDIYADGTFEKVKVRCAFGDIDITTPDPDSVDFDLNCTVGDAKVNGKKW
ncbi:MAG: DUF4097 domain-containing protein [Pseudobutyrivibrio sp.]|nr:DUF4097 domain-containing protein [Pseudobutyrivibrio sp.]